MKRMRNAVVALSLVLGLSGCATLGELFPTETYTATLIATGIVPVGPVSLGEVDVPTNGTGLINLAVLLAGKHLAHEANLKNCLFTAYAPRVEGKSIFVSASAVCKLQGLPVEELVTISLAPIAVT